MEPAPLLFEGLTGDEVLDLPDEQLRELLLTGEALVLRVGTAEVLGQFRVKGDALILELAGIEGGGEGVLPGLAALASRYARREGLHFVEWRVHAVHCAQPNLRLRRMLERRGFEIREVEGVGECFWLRVPVKPNA